MSNSRIPSEIEGDIKHCIRLEWWTIGWQLSIIFVMFLVMGSSQAMKSAWTEDLLGLVPALAFLVAIHFERKQPDSKYPYGFNRLNSLAFLISATALVGMGGYLIYDSGTKLIAAEHPTIGPIEIFGQPVWLGWLMMGALVYSVIPPVILGRMKQPLARRAQDKVLHTDALMQKADWMTGVAAIIGIGGVGFGLWWADSVAAALIAVDIVHDGVRAWRVAAAELIDGAPRALEKNEIAEDAKALRETLSDHFPGTDIRLRETGRLIRAEIRGVEPPPAPVDRAALWPGDPDRAWRFASITFSR